MDVNGVHNWLAKTRRDFGNCRGCVHDRLIKFPEKFGQYLQAAPANLMAKPAQGP